MGMTMGLPGVTSAGVPGGEPPVPPGPKVIIRPMHLTLWDESQITNVRKPIGYRWECTCGKYGRIRRKRQEAVAEGAEHRTAHG